MAARALTCGLVAFLVPAPLTFIMLAIAAGAGSFAGVLIIVSAVALPIALGIVAIVLAIIALRRRDGRTVSAIWGLSLGVLSLPLPLLLLAWLVFGVEPW